MTDSQKSPTASREETTLAFWNERNIFEKSLAKEAPKGDYVFYDGPPFATGLPHYGHLLQSAMKDAIPRYKTMCGYRVARQWGWDCHGLPIENIVEKELGTKSKKDIVAMGVKKFNDLCREQIFTCIHEWERIISRFGRWADMHKPYRTMDFAYMQSEWWAFKTLYDKGLVYEDYRSMHICPRCETTLSQGEVAEGYKDVKDLSVTVKFKVKHPEKHGLPENTYLLAWTTTPWTLPGNVALAVGTELSYGLHEQDGAYFIRYAIDGKWKGKKLVNLEYEPLFDHYAQDVNLKNRENGWKVYAADFVTTDTGTGIVHIAPAFGADDMMLGKEKNLPFIQHVKMDGTFAHEMGEFAGLDLKPRAKDKPEEIREADLTMVKHLEKEGKVFSHEKYEHPYPHCWRCDTALLNYATSSWFVAVEKMKSTLLDTAKGINWSPAHIKEGRWGQWLSGARDWSISRQRFWANTIPVWRCGTCKKDMAFGSVAELKEKSGVLVTDLHKDVVDEVVFPCVCGAGEMRRVPDVLDTWFDSGSVPFAIKDQDVVRSPEKNFQIADFIGEGQDQCRAWFYYQHVLAGGLFEKAAFKNCIVTGIVLAEDGKKMSKKLKNYPDPVEMIDKYGADAMRLYMLGSPVVRAEQLSFSEKEVAELSRKIFGRLANVYEFYALYRHVPHEPGTKSTHPLDRWILARLAQVHKEVTDGLERYALDEAARPFDRFVDDLSTWYLRRSRERIKEAESPDAVLALATTAHVLRELAKLLAPLTPFFAEWLWQNMRDTAEEESVHITHWPVVEKTGLLARLIHRHADMVIPEMEKVRAVVSHALEMREKAGVKVRQPLSLLRVPVSIQIPERYHAIIADEVNVKRIEHGGDSVWLDATITDWLREEGQVRERIREIQIFRKEHNLRPGEAAVYTCTCSEDERALIEKNRAAIEKATHTTIQFD